MDARPGLLRPRTAQMYRWVLARYLTPTFGAVHLVDIDRPYSGRGAATSITAEMDACGPPRRSSNRRNDLLTAPH